MSFRPKGHARTSPVNPQAWAVCDRCGFVYNHIDLFWQFDWEGPRYQNLRILVCRECMDLPFVHNRTIVLPPDPIPIANPRVEQYSADDNPDSLPAVNWDPLVIMAYGSTGITNNGNIGNMTGGGGVDAAFTGVSPILVGLPSSIAGPPAAVPSRKAMFSSLLMPSKAGNNNYIGQNWAMQPGTEVVAPSAIAANANKLDVITLVVQAPSDQAFLAGSSALNIELDGWNGASWVQLWTGGTAGSVGETLKLTLTSTGRGSYFGHRVLIQGDGVAAIAIAQCLFIGAGEPIISSAPGVQAS